MFVSFLRGRIHPAPKDTLTVFEFIAAERSVGTGSPIDTRSNKQLVVLRAGSEKAALLQRRDYL